VVVLAVVLPLALLGEWFGFVPPSVAFLFAIAGLSVSYLLLAQGAKWGSTACGSRPASLRRTPYLGRRQAVSREMVLGLTLVAPGSFPDRRPWSRRWIQSVARSNYRWCVTKRHTVPISPPPADNGLAARS
jgi:hypothetical protein